MARAGELSGVVTLDETRLSLCLSVDFSLTLGALVAS